MNRDGYVIVHARGHPDAKRGRKYAGAYIGRRLLSTEVVHHKNGVASDNRIENLELFGTNAEHLAKTIRGQVPKWTKIGIQKMKEAIARSAKMRRPQTRVRTAQDVHWSP